ncbi:hypothetical protein CCP2SC5_230036 [Azospirillaceae bacterium]
MESEEQFNPRQTREIIAGLFPNAIPKQYPNAELSLVQWSKAFIVGENTIDTQHRILIDTINEFTSAVNQKKTTTELIEILNHIVQYTSYHFRFEEEMMEQNHYPELEFHREQHLWFIRKLIEEHSDLDKASIDPTEVAMFLQTWLLSHVLMTDTGFGEFITQVNENAKEQK